MARATLWYSPRCSRSRETKTALNERPVVLGGEGAALGRPPEVVLELL
jgi:arsenate reductase-like glutaredoxin family protein